VGAAIAGGRGIRQERHPGAEFVTRTGHARLWRLLVWCVLVIGWLYMLLRMWDSFATFPTEERLEHSRTVAIPTLQSLALLMGRSAIELAVVLALTWPWAARRWAARAWAAALLLAAWFIATAPLTLSGVMWVHRRWLAATALFLAVAGTVSAAAWVIRRIRRPAHR
jgi:hypothetical protein